MPSNKVSNRLIVQNANFRLCAPHITIGMTEKQNNTLCTECQCTCDRCPLLGYPYYHRRQKRGRWKCACSLQSSPWLPRSTCMLLAGFELQRAVVLGPHLWGNAGNDSRAYGWGLPKHRKCAPSGPAKVQHIHIHLSLQLSECLNCNILQKKN